VTAKSRPKAYKRGPQLGSDAGFQKKDGMFFRLMTKLLPFAVYGILQIFFTKFILFPLDSHCVKKRSKSKMRKRPRPNWKTVFYLDFRGFSPLFPGAEEINLLPYPACRKESKTHQKCEKCYLVFFWTEGVIYFIAAMHLIFL